jgi:uncharacterized protein
LIAVDTNILVYAHRQHSPFNVEAAECVRTLAEGAAPWAVPWPCIHEFLAVCTNPRVLAQPSRLDEALAQVDFWLSSPTVVLLTETMAHWPDLRRALFEGRIVGPKVYDAKIAVICLAHDVEELWTADRDFARFPALRTRNPLVAR